MLDFLTFFLNLVCIGVGPLFIGNIGGKEFAKEPGFVVIQALVGLVVVAFDI